MAARPLLNLAALAAAGVPEHPLYRYTASVSGGLFSLLFFLSVLVTLFCVVLTYGYLSYGLKLWRGQETGWRDLFCGIPQAGRVLLLTLEIFLFSLLWAVLGAILLTIGVFILNTVSFLLAALSYQLGQLFLELLSLAASVGFMVFFYSRVLRYALAYYILLDQPRYRAGEALDASKDLMVGHRWTFFVLLLSFLGWFLLGSLLCSAAGLLCQQLLPSGSVGLALITWLLTSLCTLPLTLWLGPLSGLLLCRLL